MSYKIIHNNTYYVNTPLQSNHEVPGHLDWHEILEIEILGDP